MPETANTLGLEFPAGALEQCVRDALESAIDDQQVLTGAVASGSDDSGGAALGADAEIDSLVVVASLTAVDELVPFDVPESIVRPGGYQSVDEAVDSLVAEVRKIWDREFQPQEVTA